MSVAIVDYGLGNLHSIKRALEHVGASVQISSDPATIRGSDQVLLPGVGAFEHGMANLRGSGLDRVVIEAAKSGKPVLGICLGMQMLLTESRENGRWPGLNLIPGRVVRFTAPKGNQRYKIPHYGWNLLRPAAAKPRSGKDVWKGGPLAGSEAEPYVYFVHSYCATTDRPAHTLTRTRYGADDFASSIARDNVLGYQFHPELSGSAGLKLLQNFVEHPGAP